MTKKQLASYKPLGNTEASEEIRESVESQLCSFVGDILGNIVKSVKLPDGGMLVAEDDLVKFVDNTISNLFYKTDYNYHFYVDEKNEFETSEHPSINLRELKSVLSKEISIVVREFYQVIEKFLVTIPFRQIEGLVSPKKIVHRDDGNHIFEDLIGFKEKYGSYYDYDALLWLNVEFRRQIVGGSKDIVDRIMAILGYGGYNYLKAKFFKELIKSIEDNTICSNSCALMVGDIVGFASHTTRIQEYGDMEMVVNGWGDMFQEGLSFFVKSTDGEKSFRFFRNQLILLRRGGVIIPNNNLPTIIVDETKTYYDWTQVPF